MVCCEALVLVSMVLVDLSMGDSIKLAREGIGVIGYGGREVL